jgi:hypothetical protein
LEQIYNYKKHDCEASQGVKALKAFEQKKQKAKK